MLATVELPDPPADADRATVWAHAAVAGDEGVQRGDYVTTRSHPVAPGDRSATVEVTVRPVP